MNSFKKTKEKLLNLSNSYNYYKNQYYYLLDQKMNQKRQIEFLTNELSKSNAQIDKITDLIVKQNNEYAEYKSFFQKIVSRRNEEIQLIIDILNDIFKSEKNLNQNILNLEDSLRNIENSLMRNRVLLASLNDENVVKISELIDSNYKIIDLKYDDGISKIVDVVNGSSNEISLKYDEGISKITEVVNDGNNVIASKYYDAVNSIADLIKFHNENIKNRIVRMNNNLLKNHNILYSNLSKLTNAYDDYYNESRKYFLNGYDAVLSEVMDTDFLFNLCYFNNIKFLSYSPKENRMLLKTEEDIILSTNNHIWTIMEINGLNEYIVPQLFYFDDFVVFDIGMNRAYASLKFANFDNCSKVYGFEIDEFTYGWAIDNIKLNPKLSDKIKTYNFGLSDENSLVDLYYIDGYDGLNTMILDFTEIQPSLKHFKDNVDVKTAKVKIASDVISDIIESNQINSKKVLKIDTEGAEYKIINNLIKSNLITQMDVILGEGHNFSDDDFNENLLNLGFVPIKINMEAYTYSFAYVKKEYYKFWPNVPLF